MENPSAQPEPWHVGKAAAGLDAAQLLAAEPDVRRLWEEAEAAGGSLVDTVRSVVQSAESRAGSLQGQNSDSQTKAEKHWEALAGLLRNAGRFMHSAGEAKTAVAYVERSRDVGVKHLTDKHEASFLAASALGFVLLEQDAIDTALGAFQGAIESGGRVHVADRSDLSDQNAEITRVMLGAALAMVAMGRHEEALAAMLAGHDFYCDSVEGAYPFAESLAAFHECMADGLRRLNRAEEAKNWDLRSIMCKCSSTTTVESADNMELMADKMLLNNTAGAGDCFASSFAARVRQYAKEHYAPVSKAYTKLACMLLDNDCGFDDLAIFKELHRRTQWPAHAIDALEALRQARAACEARGEPPEPPEAPSQVQTARLLMAVDLVGAALTRARDFDAALRVRRQGLEMALARHGADQHLAVVKALLAVGDCLNNLSEPAQALPFLLRSLDARLALPPDEDDVDDDMVGVTHVHVGNTYLVLGRNAEAAASFESALVAHRYERGRGLRRGREGVPETLCYAAESLTNMGAARARMGDDVAAHAAFAEGLWLKMRQPGTTPHKVYREVGETALALAKLERRMRRFHLGRASVDVAECSLAKAAAPGMPEHPGLAEARLLGADIRRLATAREAGRACWACEGEGEGEGKGEGKGEGEGEGEGEGDPEVRPCKRCTRCKVARYCSVACQKAHWGGSAGHKRTCRALAAEKPEH